MKRALLLAVLLGAALSAQPPVVLINGYQLACIPFVQSSSFGALATLLSTFHINASFYDTCSCSNCSIEEHAARVEQLINSTGNGQQVDVIAASMGGLILRSYLAGKYTTASTFNPPLNPHIRKAVFIATPHFGLTAPELDARLTEMQPGSQFTWDLATWHQNLDDLRGLDAIAIIGSGGTSGNDDGLVPITSASLNFATAPERSRVIPYCHSESIPFIVNCRSDAPAIFKIDSLDHPTLKIIVSFLTGTNEWRTIGTTPSGNGALFTSPRTNTNQVPNTSGAAANSTSLLNRTDTIYYRDALPAQSYTVTFNNTNISESIRIPSGTSVARIAKASPHIERASSAAAALPHFSLAPGMIVSLYGADLTVNNTTTLRLDDAPLSLIYSGPTQVNAILPDSKTGPATLTLQNSKGADAIRVLLESAVPTLFSANFTGTGPAAALDAVTGSAISSATPAVPGQFVSLYGTGLGQTDRRGNLDVAKVTPTVSVGGTQARILYAGRAPGFPGLDQINIEIPNTRGDAVPVTVTSGFRTSNTVTLTIR